ncbi:MAG: D-2-hydroxyacid dehydrogenase [Chthoniobacterales bacterium]
MPQQSLTKKIVVLDGFTLNPGDNPWTALEALGTLEVHDRTTPDEILSRAHDAEILLTNKVPLRKETLDQLPKLRFINVLATGYDVIDIAAARERGIPVSNIPAYSTESVAQFVFAHILELTSRVGEHATAVANGDWTRSPDFCFTTSPLTELQGKTLGIIGYGRIGRRVAEIANAFGMRVLASSRSHKNALPVGPEKFAWAETDAIFKEADFISLHCPLTPETQGLVNTRRLASMKPTAFLINTGRGPLIVEDDLATALRSGTIAGAGLDVISTEPMRPDHPLLGCPRLLITPHIAWASLEARQRLMDQTAKNIAAFLADTPINVVNPEK